MSYREMAIDAGAHGPEHIEELAWYFYQLDEIAAQADHDLLGEMQYRGVEINVLPPVVEETPDTTA